MASAYTTMLQRYRDFKFEFVAKTQFLYKKPGFQLQNFFDHPIILACKAVFN